MILQDFLNALLEKARTTVVLLLAVLIVGAGATVWTVCRKDYEMRERLLGQTRRIVQTVDPKHIKSLSGTDADLESPIYQRLKSLLSTLREADDRCRFIYLMGRQPDGTVFLFVDSEDPRSKDYSPPGQVYTEASVNEAGVFETGEPIVHGPTIDRWGVWISAYFPIYDLWTDTVVALVGMDVDARVWNRDLARAAVMPIVLTLVLMAIVVVAAVLASRRRRTKTAVPLWLSYVETGVVLASGLVITLFAAWMTFEIDAYNRARIFEFLAESETHRLADEFLDLQQAELESIARFYECSEEVTEDEFTRFTAPLVGVSLAYAWGWAPAVPAAEKETFEQQVGSNGLDGFQIWGWDQRGMRVAAEGREMYFPVLRIARRDGNVDALGFDVGSEPVRRSAVMEAIQTRLCTATPPLNLVGERTDAKAIILFRPVFEAGAEGPLMGFAASIIRLDKLLVAVQDRMSVHLSLSHFGKEGVLHLLASSCDVDRSSICATSGVSRPISIHGQVLVVSAHPGPGFISRYPPHRAGLASALIGILFTTLAVVLVARPVHQRLHLEKLVSERTASLQQSEARYDQLARQSRIFTWEVDAEGLFTYASPSVETVLGYRPEELIGQKYVLELWPETERESLELEARGMIAARREFSGFENPLVSRDGRVLWIATYGVPILDASGHLLGYRGSNIDITERKRLEEKEKCLLNESEMARKDLLCTLDAQKLVEAELARLVSAVEQVDESIVITDSEGNIGYVNPTFTRITGYERAEALGENPRIVKSGEHDQAYYRQLWDAITNGRTWGGRLINRRKDGTIYTEQATISPVRDETGRIVNYVAVKRDITEQLAAEQESLRLHERLLQMQRVESIGRLAGGVAHDFNNMLGVILGYGEELLERLPADDPLRENAKQIVQAGRRSATLTQRLLAYSRRQTLHPQVLNLNALLADLEPMLKRLIGEHIQIQVAPGPDLGHVMADSGQIEQAIVNLVVNAQHAMPQGGKLTIQTANVFLDAQHALTYGEIPVGDYVMLSVSDTGCGMDRETMNQIFEPFFTTKEKGQGTGLGLASAFGIIRQSAGQIIAESEPGKGSVFRIYLPRTLNEPTDHSDDVEIDCSRGMGQHILVVEDEAALRSWIAHHLSDRGYRTSVAVDGNDALRRVRQEGLRPDLLLTDVVMPGIRGTELADRLRGELPELRVLLMSGYTDELVRSHGALDPAVHLLSKPFQGDDLARKVREALQRRTEPQRGKNILMIDDELLFRELIAHHSSQRGHGFTGVETAAEALEALSSREFDVLLLDRNLPGSDGRRILQEIRQAGYSLPAILLTGDLGSVDLPAFRELGVIQAVEKSGDNRPLLDWIELHL